MLIRALQLPSDIWREFIFPCFSVETLGCLDTALAYSSDHSTLLQHQKGWVWKPESHIYLSKHSLKWVRRRKIVVTHCLVDPTSIYEIGPAVFLFLCNVQSLRVVNFTDANLLDQILECVECIHDLHISYNNANFFDIERKTVDCIQVCNKMISFASDRCPAINDDSLHQLVWYCPKIITFSLNNSKGSCSSESIAYFLREMPHLRSLELLECRGIDDNVGMTISTHCRALTSLTLTSNVSISERTLLDVVMHCDQLTALDLSGTRFSNTALCALAEHCPRLTELHLKSCKLADSSLQYFFGMRTKLSKLSLTISLQSELSFEVTARSWSSMRELSMKTFGLNHQQLLSIASNCLQLRKLDVSCCSFFPCHELSALRSLTEVSLSGSVNDATVSSLSEACPQLQVVDVTGCVSITDVSLEVLARCCVGLRELRCGGHYLPCQPCPGITVAGVLHLAAHSAQLRRLCVMHCPGVQECVMVTLRDRYPRIQVEWYRAAHVLVVDDVRVNVTMRVRMLRQAGHTSESATNGEEALQKMIASKEPGARAYDLVLTDEIMPVMCGSEATIRLRSYEHVQAQQTGKTNRLLIIGTSAIMGMDARVDSLKIGMDAYLEIPFFFPQLCEEFATIPRSLRPLNFVL